MKLENFFQKSWDRYVQLTPDAPVIHSLFEKRGEKVINDHVAYRTFDLPGISRDDLGRVFEEWGYVKHPEDLLFPDKKLIANYWIHPDSDQPKVFISELKTGDVSAPLRDWIKSFVARRLASGPRWTAEDFLTPSWEPVDFEAYSRFYPESEYAAWTAAFGIQLNHFTVFINRLKTLKTVQELNTFLKTNGLTLNAAGGEIKGTPAELLEQSSTMAKKVPCIFAGGRTESVMGCYYEFALRHQIPGKNTLFQGFIPKSADKIFESNYEKK